MFGYRESSRLDARGVVESSLTALRQQGFEPPPLDATRPAIGCGAALSVAVRDAIDNSAAFLKTLCELAAGATPICLSPIDFGRPDSAVDAWQTLCELVRATLSAHGLPARGIATCIHAHQMPLEAYCLIADSVLGAGPRYVHLDCLQMADHHEPGVTERAAANWRFLWRQRGATRPVMPVYGGLVRSGCPLLSGEVASSILPVGGLHIPAGSAWLPIEVRLTRFADRHGGIDEQRLHAALGRTLVAADRLFDHLEWPCPRQRADALENRRIAFVLQGFGDLVRQSGRDPADLDCLRWLSHLAQGIRGELNAVSARLAGQSGPLPALSMDAAGSWSVGAKRDAWNRRWRVALRKCAVRHRNLVVMSPYTVLPTDGACAPEFTDLLPLIAHADAWSFAGMPACRGWDAAQFRQFHRRAWAIIQGSHATSFVAAGV